MEDWLETQERVPALPIPIELPAEPAARVALAEQCWAALTDKQRIWLAAFRDNRLNARRTARATEIDRRSHAGWIRSSREYATIVRLWMGITGSEALDKDRLLARQDDIVETLLTPKPVLYMGAPTGFEEVEAGGASRANEVLMKAAGLLKDRDIEVNVGVALNGPPTLSIQVLPKPPSAVVQREQVVIDAKYVEVPSDDWLGA